MMMKHEIASCGQPLMPLRHGSRSGRAGASGIFVRAQPSVWTRSLPDPDLANVMQQGCQLIGQIVAIDLQLAAHLLCK
jgi:hypothetical protein